MTTSVTQDGGITVGTMGDVMKQLDYRELEGQTIWVAVPHRPADPPRDLIEYQARANLYDDILEMIDSRLRALQQEGNKYRPKNPTETLVELKQLLEDSKAVNERGDGAAYSREGWAEDGSPEEFRIGKITYNRGRLVSAADRVILEP